MHTVVNRILAFIGCSAVSAAALAGVTHVRFIEPDRFTDTHLSGEPVGDVLDQLERLMVGLGQRCVPPGETLDIDVLDVDLAGSGRFVPARHAEVRLVTGLADAPRITLRYAVSENGRRVAAQEVSLRDLAFLDHHRLSVTNESYPYEKQLIRDWFKEKFGSACALPAQAGRP